jgi:uncharacterized protein (DUF433 family)
MPVATFQIHDPFRTGKAYTVAQAARLAGTSPGTIRNWLFGDKDRMSPVLIGRPRALNVVQRVSFLELVDFVIVARYRRWGTDLEVIRAAHSFAKTEWGVPYPFASLNLLPLGGHVLRRFEETHPSMGQFVVMTSPGQFVLPGMVQDEAENMDFDPDDHDPFAVRWHSYGRDVPIVVDPRFGGGMPTIEGTGVTVNVVLRRYESGETRRSIASDFNLKFAVVEQVIKHAA